MEEPKRLLLIAVGLEVAAFAISAALPVEYATGIVFAVIMCIAFWLPRRSQIFGLAIAGSLLLAAAYLLSPFSEGGDHVSSITNRGLAVVAMWLVAVLADQHRRSVAALRRGEASLEETLRLYKEAEKAVSMREARIRSILETAPEAWIIINSKGIIESFSASAERLFGYDAEEIVGQNVNRLMPTPHREQHDSYLERYMRTGERRIIGIGRVVEGKRKDGTIFPMELAVGEVSTGGEPIFTGFVRDLTSRHRMEQELRQSQRMEAVGQLTGGIAHDFNNLLTVIIGNLEMLSERIGTEGRPAGWLKEAYDTAQLGAELTQRLLAFGRRQSLQPIVVDLKQMIADSTKLLRRTLGEGVEVKTVFDEEEHRSLVDPGQLQNALLNLAINARDAMPDGGRLIIETSNANIDPDFAATHPEARPGRYATISVTDTGTGMTPEVREKAFEPFFTTKPVGAGSGLGLSMVYGFVKQSGGHVQIYSEPGLGTTVRMYLPSAEDGDTAAAQRSEATASSFAGLGENILVVEDDPRVRRVTVERLTNFGYNVTEAENGPVALEKLRSGVTVDLLFTDMIMPGGMTGDDLVEEARRLRPGLKVIFTSGYAEPEMARRVSLEGARWLPKPSTAVQLARIVREILDA